VAGVILMIACEVACHRRSPILARKR
jgi:hypothetical protein